jgi:hypothetical protein
MPFSYYTRLSSRDQETYRRSDEIEAIVLPHPELLRPLVAALEKALVREDRRAVTAAAELLARGVTRMLGVPAVTVEVWAVRPSGRGGELHGLYTRDEGRPPGLRLWMRTARHRRVVAFRTFLRTLVHEVAHHLDYEHLRLEESFHTEGFFRRESSLVRQLLGEA